MIDMSVRKEKKEETRELLKHAAIEVFHEKGIHLARVSDIVARAGVAQGTFYNYFKSKEMIFREIADDYLMHYGVLFSRYADAFVGIRGKKEMISSSKTFLRQLIASCKENIKTAQLVFGEGAGSKGPYYEISQHAISHFVELIQMVVEGLQKKGYIHFQDAEMAGTMLFGLFQRTMFYFLLAKEEYDPVRLENAILDFVFHGLGWKN